MKLKINGEYADVSFWSFVKMNFWASVVVNLIGMAVMGVIFWIIGVTIA